MMDLFTSIWQLVVLSTLWCVGWYMNSREPGDALYFSRKLTEKWPAALKKPIAHCINCMASLHTLVVFVLYCLAVEYFPPVKLFVIVWAITTVIVSGTNGIVFAVYRYFEIMITFNEKEDGNEQASE